jgi:hypothetical protein
MGVRQYTPGGEHRLARLPQMQPLGKAVDEQVDHRELGQIAAGKRLVFRPQSLRASEFLILSQSGERPEPQELLAVTAVLPVVRRMVIPVVVVVLRGVVTPVVGVDVGIAE